MKGRVACLFTDHELVLTELLVSNELSGLEVQEIAAVMSGFVFQQKSNDEPQAVVSESLTKAKEAIQSIAKRVGLVQHDCGLKEAVQDFVDEIKFGLVDVALEWAKGTVTKSVNLIVLFYIQLHSYVCSLFIKWSK